MLQTYGNSYQIAGALKVDQSQVIRRLQKYGLALPRRRKRAPAAKSAGQG